MFLVVVGIVIFLLYIICKVGESDSDSNKAIGRILIIAGIACCVLDAIFKGLGTIILVLLLIAYGWFTLYNK